MPRWRDKLDAYRARQTEAARGDDAANCADGALRGRRSGPATDGASDDGQGFGGRGAVAGKTAGSRSEARSTGDCPSSPGTLGADGRPATLGVMGGGQLGRMFVHAAQPMGYCTAVLDPDPTSPAGLVAHYHMQADYLDEPGLAQLMQRCSAITTEFENVPAAALCTLGAQRPVAPSAECVAVCQDRAAEKPHFVAAACPARPSR